MIKPGPWRYPGGPVTAVGTLMVRRKLEEGELEKPARNGMVSTQPGRRRYWVEALDTGSLQGDTQRTGAERGQGICWHSTAGSKDEARIVESTFLLTTNNTENIKRIVPWVDEKKCKRIKH